MIKADWYKDNHRGIIYHVEIIPTVHGRSRYELQPVVEIKDLRAGL